MRRKLNSKRMSAAVIVIVGMALCMNVVFFTEQPTGVKVTCGVVAGLLYLSLFLMMYWTEKRKGDKQNFCKFMKGMVMEDEEAKVNIEGV